jgi:hypothetical protein
MATTYQFARSRNLPIFRIPALRNERGKPLAWVKQSYYNKMDNKTGNMHMLAHFVIGMPVPKPLDDDANYR